MDDFFAFLSKAPTVWHAAREISNRLAQADWTPLLETEPWELERGQGYFVQRDGALLCAFRLPKNVPTSALLLASHIDSPGLKIKPHPDLLTRDIAQLGTEVYGGPLLHTWLDRDLAIAGRLETDRGSHLVLLDDCPLIIPQLPIHLDRNINEKGICVHRQDHLKPVLSIQGGATLEKLFKKHLHFDALYTFDLFLVPLEKPACIGIDANLIAGFRMDNLSSAYACLEALLHASTREDLIQMAIFWDHEEIGSLSATGADSMFVEQVLERIGLALGQTREEFHQLKARSLILSADVAHGWNPNFPDKYDPQNASLLGQGIVFKFNAARKYASDTAAIARLSQIAKKHQLKIQHSANRSDIPSGSTVGPIMSANTGIRTVDLGISCWSMHSVREIISADDQRDLGVFLARVLDEYA